MDTPDDITLFKVIPRKLKLFVYSPNSAMIDARPPKINGLQSLSPITHEEFEENCVYLSTR